MALHVRLIEWDWYTNAKIEFEERARAENFFEKFLGRDVVEREVPPHTLQSQFLASFIEDLPFSLVFSTENNHYTATAEN